MKALPLAVLAMLAAVAVSNAQDVSHGVAVTVVVDENGREMSWTSNDADFASLQVGESRVVETDAGEPMTITRTENGMTLSVNGETIELPPIGAHPMPMAAFGVEPGNFDVDVIAVPGEPVPPPPHVAGRVFRAGPGGPDGVTIISAEPLDDSVKESIRSVLISAGRDDEVTFVDRSSRTHLIQKRVELTNEATN